MTYFSPTKLKTSIGQTQGVVTEPGNFSSEDPSLVINGIVEADEYIGETFPESVARRYDTRTIHEPTITGGRGTNAPGQGPTATVNGTLLTLAFTPDDTNDRAFRIFKIPTSYVTGSAFHIHWTKGVDTNQSGSHVRWKVDYSVFDGIDDVANGAPYTFEIEDTYDDPGTTTRVVYRTSNIPLSGFVAGWYVSCFIEAISPIGSPALSGEPNLFSLDLTYTATINSGTV
jgi:hypothetical protein